MATIQSTRSSNDTTQEELSTLKKQVKDLKEEKDVAVREALSKSAQVDETMVALDEARKKATEEKQAKNALLEELYYLQNKVTPKKYLLYN